MLSYYILNKNSSINNKKKKEIQYILSLLGVIRIFLWSSFYRLKLTATSTMGQLGGSTSGEVLSSSIPTIWKETHMLISINYCIGHEWNFTVNIKFNAIHKLNI